MRKLGWFLFAVIASNLFASIPKASVQYDITPLFTAAMNSGALSQAGGKYVRFKTRITPGVKVIFEDLLPGANWRHPARLKVVSAAGAVMEEIPTDLPPRDLHRAQVLSGTAYFGTKVEFKIDSFGGKYRVADPSKHYAFLLNGQADLRHWNDMSFLYRVLTQVYGFNPSNIIISDGVFKDSQPDLDGNGTPDIQYGSKAADVKEAMKWLKDHLTEQDDLILAVNDHGGSIDNESTIVLEDVEMKATEFTTMLAAVPVRKLIAIYEQCFSGGFVRPTLKDGRIAMAASTNSEYSWATRDLNFDEFIYHVISAFGMQRHDGTPVASDVNGDERVSAKEAFSFAVGKDVAAESPLLEAPNNSGQAEEFGLGF